MMPQFYFTKQYQQQSSGQPSTAIALKILVNHSKRISSLKSIIVFGMCAKKLVNASYFKTTRRSITIFRNNRIWFVRGKYCAKNTILKVGKFSCFLEVFIKFWQKSHLRFYGWVNNRQMSQGRS